MFIKDTFHKLGPSSMNFHLLICVLDLMLLTATLKEATNNKYE